MRRLHLRTAWIFHLEQEVVSLAEGKLKDIPEPVLKCPVQSGGPCAKPGRRIAREANVAEQLSTQPSPSALEQTIRYLTHEGCTTMSDTVSGLNPFAAEFVPSTSKDQDVQGFEVDESQVSEFVPAGVPYFPPRAAEQGFEVDWQRWYMYKNGGGGILADAYLDALQGMCRRGQLTYEQAKEIAVKRLDWLKQWEPISAVERDTLANEIADVEEVISILNSFLRPRKRKAKTRR